jgi:hypothetical protein
MLSSLSDRTKTFIVYSAVLVVAVCNIVFGLNWVVASGPPPKLAVATPAPSYAPLAVPNSPFAPDGSPLAPTPPAAVPAAKAAEAAPPKCDVDACADAYRSFQASDCTYQPIGGPRRLCTKGNPPR